MIQPRTFGSGNNTKGRATRPYAYTRFNFADRAHTRWNNGPYSTYTAARFSGLSPSEKMTLIAHEMSHPGHADLSSAQVDQNYSPNVISEACHTDVAN
jgi:hypothetical protein